MGLVSGVARLVLVVGLAFPAFAEDLRRISVTGEGVVEAVPDMAVVTLGVEHTAKTARAAMDQTNAATAAVLERLEAAGIAARDMQTSDLSLSPVWHNRTSSGTPSEPRITGFTARNRLTVRVRALDSLGETLDLLVDDGANRFDGLRFAVQEPRPFQDEARRRAVADALAKAQLYAEAAGVALGPVQTIGEAGGFEPRPMQMEMAMARDAAVPVAPGEVSLRARVSMVFAIAD